MSDIILAIETSSEACSAALWQNGAVIERYEVVPQAHAKLLLGMIDSLLKEAGITLDQISAFAFGKGPGSFTGLRIAAGIIQGLAFGVNRPVIGISTLKALASSTFEALNSKQILVALDARMKEIYWGFYEMNDQEIVASVEERVESPVSLQLSEEMIGLAVGTGFINYHDSLKARYPALQIETSICYPSAKEVAKLASIELQNNNVVSPALALPVYLRDQVAKKSKNRNK